MYEQILEDVIFGDALCRRHSAGGAGLCLPAVPAGQRLCRRRHAAIAAQTLGGCVPDGHRLGPRVVPAGNHDGRWRGC